MTNPPLLPQIDAEVCCAPVTAGVLEVQDAERLARMFRALGDPTRVRLLSLIAAQPNREACVCDLTGPVGLAQPTVSHHLRQLVEAGLVEREQRGRWGYYTIIPATLGLLSDVLDPRSGVRPG